jgi:microcystin-dependent protein
VTEVSGESGATTPQAPAGTGGVSPSTLSDLADAIAVPAAPSGSDNRPTDGAVLRYGKVTAVGTGANAGKAQTDTTGLYWNPCDNSYLPAVGDLVYLFQQGPVSHIGGRLGGQPSAPPVGIIHPYAGATAPLGWLLCNGAAVSRTTYAELFAVCGTTYGAGDGSTTFNLPNLTDRVPTGSGSLYARGEKGGSETVTLTTSNMPAHTHTVNPGAHSHTINHDHVNDPHTHSVPASSSQNVASGTGATVANNATGTSGSTTNNTQTYNGSSGSTDLPTYTSTSIGSGTAFNNMPPYLGVNYVVRAVR